MMNTNKIKVLHILGGLNTGGAETLVMNLYKNINRNEFEFDFIIHEENKCFYEDEITSLGGRIYRSPKYNVFNHFKYIEFWDEFFKNHEEYQIIHCHIRSTASIILKCAKKYNRKTICHSHSISNGVGIKSAVKYLLQKNISNYCDYMLACSNNAAKWLFGKKNVNKSNCIILYNGIDYNKFSYNADFRREIRDKYGINDNTIVIGHIGRFDDVKNHTFILNLANKLVLENSNIKFMLCGDGNLKENVMKKARDMGLSNNILFVDSTSEIYKYYNVFDMFILPSKYEGLGIVLIEAQFNGLKCFASDCVPRDTVISDKIEFLRLDLNLWKSKITDGFKNNSRNIVFNEDAKKFYIEYSIEQLVNIYKKLVKY